MMPGEFEERLKAVLNEVSQQRGRVILFIDDIHNLVPAAGAAVSQSVRSLQGRRVVATGSVMSQCVQAHLAVGDDDDDDDAKIPMFSGASALWQVNRLVPV
jgi:hypothetical protein